MTHREFSLNASYAEILYCLKQNSMVNILLIRDPGWSPSHDPIGIFSSSCQMQCELLPSLGIRRPLTFHILIFSSETAK